MTSPNALSYSRFAAIGASLVLLSACSSFEPDPVRCNERVTAMELGARSSLLALETGEPIEVRLNGVSASCINYETETYIDIKVGLKVLRPQSDIDRVAQLEVPFVVAAVAGDDTVIEHDAFGFKMALSSDTRTLYPVVEFGITIPLDGRAVISLTPEGLQIK
ncbi:MAG: hypothetical protein ACN4F7_04280 [Candidatus Puniceispirillaceae bacterium]